MKQLIFLLKISCILLAVACKKDNFQNTPATTNPHIAVALNKQYLNGAKLDSAIVTWEINGQKKTAKMLLRNDSLIADSF